MEITVLPFFFFYEIPDKIEYCTACGLIKYLVYTFTDK